MNELSAPLCPALVAKVQSSDLWRVCVCLRRELKESIWPFDFIFTGEVLIKTGVRSGSTWGTLSSSEGETGNKCWCLRRADTKSLWLKNTHIYFGGKTKKKACGVYLLLRAPFLDPINQLMLHWFIWLLQLHQASFWHFSSVYNPNENVLPSGAT